MASLWKFIVLLCLAAVALAIGCRTPQIVTQLERENYALESKIWELVSQLEQKQAELDACRSELERLKSRAGATSQKANPSSHPRELYAPTWPEGGDMLAPAPSVGSSTEPFALPEVSVTPPSRETSPERALPGSTSHRPPEPSPEEKPSPEENSVTRPLLLAPSNSDAEPTPDILPQETTRRASPLDSSRVSSPASAIPISIPSSRGEKADQVGPMTERIILPPKFVTGRDYDGEDGDDGIAVLVQPRDSRGEVILEPAAISVVVVDPAMTGPAARVARWDLQPEEVRSYAVRRGDVLGFLLELPWPNRLPEHEDLKVFVRYYAPDGRYLEAQSDVRVSLARSGS